MPSWTGVECGVFADSIHKGPNHTLLRRYVVCKTIVAAHSTKKKLMYQNTAPLLNAVCPWGCFRAHLRKNNPLKAAQSSTIADSTQFNLNVFHSVKMTTIHKTFRYIT